MNQLEALVGLNLTGDIGTIRLKKLLNYFAKPQDIFNASCDNLMAICGIGEKIASSILSFKKQDLDKEFMQVKKQNLKIITVENQDYPENLKQIYDPPIVLYVKGSLNKQDKLSIAIVGSRRASFYGLSCAEKFAADLSRYGFTIVSGMARGIDTYAHKGALKEGRRTIAVIGSGFCHLYPQENKELAEEISRCGAVISEFPINARPLSQNFPRRNRVISGLSLGVLVVEAARNSGALITADFALEQGREVFALPGKVDSRTSFGTNELIKQGAKLVSCVEDIVEEFNLETVKNDTLPDALGKTRYDARLTRRLSSEESLLYNLVSNQPILLDEIVERSNLSITSISDILLKLQIKKLIRQLPGKQFVRGPDAE